MSFDFRNLFIAVAGFLSLSVLAGSCSKDVPEQEDGGGLAGNVTVKFAADYTSVMRNPLNGWVTYLGRDEAWCNSFPENYTDFTIPGTGEKVNVFDYSSTAYLRTNWKAMEPTEGDYFWLHEDHYYTRMLQACWDMGVKVAFRITFDGRDQQQNTPDYVFEAGADWYDQPGYEGHGRISPYPDDPVFQEKFAKFIEAFAREFDDPDKVDFIDGFSPGKWGEAHALIYKDPANKAAFFDWFTSLYSRCFTRVPLIINYHRLIADTNQDSWQETVPADTEPLLESAIAKGYSLRHDAFGMTGYYKDWEKAFAAKWNFKRPILMEGGWVLGTHRYWIDPSGDYIEGEPWTVREGEFKASQEARVNTMDFRGGDEINSWFDSCMDLIHRFIEEGGYRLYPPIVSVPETLSNGKEVTVEHRWSNLGWGYCPNNIPQWNYKYRVAFALLDASGNEVAKYVDTNSDPSEWIKGRITRYRFNFTPENVPAGEYTLAIGIVDTSKEGNPVGLQIAVKENVLTEDRWAKVLDVTVQ